MRWMLIAIAVLGFLAVGCERGMPSGNQPATSAEPSSVTPASITSNPTGPSYLPQPSVTAPSATASSNTPPPTGRPAVPSAEDLCARPVTQSQTGAVLSMSPPAPRGGETVTVIGSGLAPGDYGASMGIPNSDGVLFAGVPLGHVGINGALRGTFVMPSVAPGTCLRLIAYPDPSAPMHPAETIAAATPFLSRQNAVVPGRCEDLPDAPLRTGGHRAEISPPPYRVGEPITVTASGLGKAMLQFASGVGIHFSVYFAERSQAPLIDTDATAWDRDGNFSATFTPRGDPRFSGLCIEVAVMRNVVAGPGSTFGVARFTYP